MARIKREMPIKPVVAFMTPSALAKKMRAVSIESIAQRNFYEPRPEDLHPQALLLAEIAFAYLNKHLKQEESLPRFKHRFYSEDGDEVGINVGYNFDRRYHKSVIDVASQYFDTTAKELGWTTGSLEGQNYCKEESAMDIYIRLSGHADQIQEFTQ